jgi:hypothetical protein
VPRRGVVFLSRALSFWEPSPPMGPPEDCTREPGHAERAERRKRPARRPRTRPCLLKGCERRFRPRHARDRYCSAECRQAARQWSRWKAQQRYRATAAGKEKRNGQSRRYRERVRNRPQAAPAEALAEAARVIPQNFFRSLLRPPRLLPGIRQEAAIAPPALLFARVPARHGAGLAARAALASRPPAAVELVSGGGGR